MVYVNLKINAEGRLSPLRRIPLSLLSKNTYSCATSGVGSLALRRVSVSSRRAVIKKVLPLSHQHLEQRPAQTAVQHYNLRATSKSKRDQLF